MWRIISPECKYKDRTYRSTIIWEMILSWRSLQPVHGMQIWWISWWLGTYLQENIRRNWYTSAGFTYGMTNIYSKSVLMVYSTTVSRCVRPAKFLGIVTPHHMEDITKPSVPMQKFGKVDFSGQTCMETQSNLCGVAQDVKSMGISIPEMQCH